MKIILIINYNVILSNKIIDIYTLLVYYYNNSKMKYCEQCSQNVRRE